MSTLKELLIQQETLAKQIEEVRLSERKGAINQAQILISDYQLTQIDLFGSENSGKPTKPTKKLPAKYRDPDTGKEWSGRGATPKWIKNSGKNKAEFLIVPTQN